MPDTSPSHPLADPTRCLFCREKIASDASVCPHCRGVLAPVRELMASNTDLTKRLAEAEAELARTKEVSAFSVAVAEIAGPVADPKLARGFCWRTLAEQVFLTLATLVVVHLLLTSLPPLPIVAYRTITLLLALPFGLQFERRGHPHLTGQVFGALCFAAVAVGVVIGVDAVLDIHMAGAVSAAERAQAGVSIALGHFTGSMAGRWWQNHVDRRARRRGSVVVDRASLIDLLRDPERLKTQVEAYRTLIEAGAPVAAAVAAVWASLGH